MMKFRHAMITLAVASAGAFVPAPAHAAPPVTSPPPGVVDLALTAEDTGCGAVDVHIVDASTARVFTNQAAGRSWTIITGQISATLTSQVTGRSISLNVSGPARIVDAFVLMGPSLLFGFGSLAYAHGRVVIPDPSVEGFTITGRLTDLCPQLVG